MTRQLQLLLISKRRLEHLQCRDLFSNRARGYLRGVLEVAL